MTTTNALMKTGQRKRVKALNPNVRKLVDLVLPYLKENGMVDWEQVDNLQKGWDSRFPNRDWAVKTASRLSSSGRFLFEKNQANGNAQSNGSGMQEKMEDAVKAVILAYTQYPLIRHGKRLVNWRLALEDHPEWVKLFCYKNHVKTRQTFRATQILARLRNNGVLKDTALTEANPKAPEPVTEVTEQERQEYLEMRIEQEGVKMAALRLQKFYQRMGFCPQCGLDLRAHFDVAMTAVKKTA